MFEPPPHPLKNHKNIEFLSNTGQDPLNNCKVTKPAFNVGPSSTRQRNVIQMVFRLWPDDCPLKELFGSSHKLRKKREKKALSKVDPL